MVCEAAWLPKDELDKLRNENEVLIAAIEAHKVAVDIANKEIDTCHRTMWMLGATLVFTLVMFFLKVVAA